MAPSSSSNPKNIPLKFPRGPFVSSELQDTVLAKVAEWKPLFKFQSFQEKQRSVRASETEQQLSELHGELKRAKEERSHALEEIAELKRFSGKSVQSIDKIKLVELQAEKAMESERMMLDSMFHQTTQLVQTKVSLEEAKLEIRNLQESIRMIEDLAGLSHQSLDNKESLESFGTQQEIVKLRNDLRLALDAEAKSKKAMDNLAIALMEVTRDTNQAKAELVLRQSELEKTRKETESDNVLLKITEQNLLEALDRYDKMKSEYEESFALWMQKEDDLLNELRMSEEDLSMEKQENSRVNIAWKAASEENIKLRIIIKQAVNEASIVKESLEILRNENYELKNQLIEKENSLQQARRNYESLKVSEAAALVCVKELKCLFATTSAIDSKNASNFADVESFTLSKGTADDVKKNKCLKIFPSQRLKPDYILVNNGTRRSMGEPGMYKESDKEGIHETKRVMVSSSSNERGTSDLKSDTEVIHFPGTVIKNLKKKKTILRRLGDTLRRRSIHN